MRFFRNRFRARLVLASFAGQVTPLAAAGGYMLVTPQAADATLLSVLAVTTCAATVATSVRLRRETAPVVNIAHALRDFARNRTWHPVSHPPFDEIGQLARAAGNLTATVTDLDSERKHAANRDPLTGLPNRIAFMETIGERTPASLALIDVDRLKSVNDLYGHEAGDEALCGVAATMAGELGDNDLLARWSGEEFILYLEEDDPDLARRRLERLREAVAANTGISPHRITVSAGLVAMSGDIGIDAAAAEELLRAAKNAGGNRVMTPTLAIEGGAGDLRDLIEPFDVEALYARG